MTAADDESILTVLRSVSSLTVFDGEVTDSDATAATISAPLPYVVFHALPDDDEPGESLAGSVGAHLVRFQITWVGEDREQARLVGERAAAAINRQFVPMPGGVRFVRRDGGLGVRRDDTWTQPDGRPLFYGADTYVVGV